MSHKETSNRLNVPYLYQKGCNEANYNTTNYAAICHSKSDLGTENYVLMPVHFTHINTSFKNTLATTHKRELTT